MSILAIEGFVDEKGQIKLQADALLPVGAKVYVIIPELRLSHSEPKHPCILSPRLAYQEHGDRYIVEIIEE